MQGAGMETEDEDWYENDLQLAAELGKALLEKNRELEVQLFQLQQSNSDQSLEIEYLVRQIETSRETADSRMRMCEELDKAVQDLEKTNQRLTLDSKADKQKIEKLCTNYENLEEKCEELQKSLDEMKAKEKKLQKQKQDQRRTVSLGRLEGKEVHIDLNDIQWTYTDKFRTLPLNPFEVEIRNLQEIIKQLKAQQLIEKRRRDDLETETALLWDENQAQECKIKELEERLKDKHKLEEDLQNLRVKYAKICEQCGDLLSPELKNGLESEIEHDNPQMARGKSLGAESLEAEADEQENAGVSILNELEVQYQSLFQKYEALLQGKGKRPPSFGDEETLDEALQKHLRGVSHKEVQTLLKTFDTTVTHEAVGGTEDPPPYKTIFRDIFETLRKSKIEEGGELPPIPSGHSTPATTPLTPEAPTLGE